MKYVTSLSYVMRAQLFADKYVTRLSYMITEQLFVDEIILLFDTS